MVFHDPGPSRQVENIQRKILDIVSSKSAHRDPRNDRKTDSLRILKEASVRILKEASSRILKEASLRILTLGC